MPPPICMPPGKAASAGRAWLSFPGPSMMTWPPLSPSRLYNPANHAAGFSETKFVRKSAGAPSVPPTICFTLPSCRSMQGRNMAYWNSIGLRRRMQIRGCRRFLPGQNSLYNRRGKLSAIRRTVDLFALDRIGHIAAFNQNRRHRRVAQHRKTRAPHPAVVRVKILHERLLHFIREQQALVFVAVGGGGPKTGQRAKFSAFAVRVG